MMGVCRVKLNYGVDDEEILFWLVIDGSFQNFLGFVVDADFG
jgi:hypothetical protein